MAFKTLNPSGFRASKSVGPTVRIACYHGLTEVRFNRELVEKLGIPIQKGNYRANVRVALGSDEHQGLIQISMSDQPNRTAYLTNGNLIMRIGKTDTPKLISSADPAGKLLATPVTWVLEGKILTVEMPSARFEVVPSAKAYMRRDAPPATAAAKPERRSIGTPAGL